MWYLFLILYTYCGFVMVATAAEIGRRNDPNTRRNFTEILFLSVTVSFLWPVFVWLAIRDWNE